MDYHTNTTNIRNSSRQLRYTVEPRALKDYNKDATTVLVEDINDVVTVFDVSDATPLETNTYIMINEESMFVKNIDGNTITVSRGKDNTIKTSHSEGDNINLINSQDDEMINYGDDFGFDEDYFDFNDGKIYSPRKGIDL